MLLEAWIKQEGGVRAAADRHGLCVSSLHNWLSGSRFPRPAAMQRLQDAAKGELDFDTLRRTFLKRRQCAAAPRRTSGALVLNSVSRLKTVLEECGIAPARANLLGERFIARATLHRFTVAELRRAVQLVRAMGRDADSLEVLYKALAHNRKMEEGKLSE